MITIPELPHTPPNFRQKSDFNSYQKPVMTVVEPPISELASNNDDTESILVDFSDSNQLNTSSSSSTNNEISSSNNQQQQQYLYIQQLLQEIENLRSEINRISFEVNF